MSELKRPEAATTPNPVASSRRFSWALGAAVILGTTLPLVFVLGMGGPDQSANNEKKADAKTDPKAEPTPPDEKKKVAAPEIDCGVALLNTAGPLSLKKDL